MNSSQNYRPARYRPILDYSQAAKAWNIKSAPYKQFQRFIMEKLVKTLDV